MIIKYGITSTEFDVVNSANVPNWMKKRSEKKTDKSEESADSDKSCDKSGDDEDGQ